MIFWTPTVVVQTSVTTRMLRLGIGVYVFIAVGRIKWR